MELKKRILSAFILVTVLGSGMYLGIKENEAELAREKKASDVRIEITKILEEASMGIDRDSLEFVSMALLDRLVKENPIQVSDETKTEAQAISYIEHLRTTKNALEAYNGYLAELTDSDISLTEEDIAYLSSLDNFKYASVAAIKSPTTNEYKIFYTSDDSKDYIKMGEDGLVLITNYNGVRGNYYDADIVSCETRELMDDEAMGLVSIREFISDNGIEATGYCFPEHGKVTPSDETIETIKEVYGDAVAECVNIFGLPVAYYDAKVLEDAFNKQDVAVKGLNN